MENKIAIGLALAVLLGLVFNAWTLSGINARVAALETSGGTLPAAAAAGVQPGETVAGVGDPRGLPELEPPGRHATPSKRWGSERPVLPDGASALPDHDRPPPVDFNDPDVREQLAAFMEEADQERREVRHEERSARWMESMSDEVDALSDEFSWDDDTTGSVRLVMNERHDAWRAVHNDVRSGAISWIDGRKEMDAVRTDSEVKLRDLVGDDGYDALDERIFGERGRH